MTEVQLDLENFTKQIDIINPLIEKMSEDEKKMLEDEQDVQELNNKITEQLINICLKSKKLEQDFRDSQEELPSEVMLAIMGILYFCSKNEKLVEKWENGQEVS